MSEYQLARTRSAAIVRSSSLDRPTVLLSRTYSVPDVTGYVRASDRYKPQWPSYYTYRSTYPYRYYRDYSLYDDYWYDRYYYFSPLYYRSLFPRRYYYSDYVTNPYYWSSSPSYWTRYKNYNYTYGWPYGYRRYADPYYESYLTSTYRPYRSWLYDSMTGSLLNALELYRTGACSFAFLDRRYLAGSSPWDQRFKDYRALYYWHNQSAYRAADHANPANRQYYTEWTQ